MRRVLILVENLPSPFDRRVWQEACTLRDAGYEVSIVCPTGRGCEKRFEVIDSIHIYRYGLPLEASGALGYALEYVSAIAQSFILSWRVLLTRGFDVVHACNPPDLLVLIGGFFKLLGKKFLFDHHDLAPELYEAKFGRRDFFYRLLLSLERLTFRAADVSIATNESYRRIAITRGAMAPERVFVVRSGPDLTRLRRLPPEESLKRGRRYLVGYVGVMGQQEGVDYLLRAVHHIVFGLKRRDIHFGLVGGGTALEEMKGLAEELGVAEFVTFTGRVPDAELLAMLNTADVCVNPDVANEMNDKSTMNKIMEYMALGKPIVQFDLTEGRFSAQSASLYARRNDAVDLARKIVELLDDPERRAAMGAFGRRRVEEQLEWRHEAPRLLAAYQALWGGGVRQPAPRADKRSRSRARLLASLIAVAAAVDARVHAGADARFACGFESSWSACGFAEQAKARDRISLIEVAGRSGVRLRTFPGDRDIAGSGGAERADLALSSEATGCFEGQEQWWAHSLLFPSEYELPVATAADPWPWGVVFDFHHTGSRGQANFQVDVADFPPRLRFAISAGPVVSSGAPGSPTRHWEIGPIVKNRWYDFVYHVKWSSRSDGWFDGWVNGKQVLHYLGPTLYAGQGCYLKLANYHTPVGKPVAVVHGRVLRGSTREALGSGAPP